MQSRRAFTASVLTLLPLQAHPQGAAFTGRWQGEVPYIGAARLIITAVRPDGLVEGRMEFDVDSYVSTFADKRDPVANTNRGVVSGSVLVIEASLGGKYDLTLDGGRLNGVYTRGEPLRETIRVPVTFTRF